MKNGNIRDYADVLHLIVLSNLEVLNASMIENNISQRERLEKLNNTARKELSILVNDNNIIGIRNNKYSCAIGNVVYYINHLKLLGVDDSMVNDELSTSSRGFNMNDESMLGKVFGYFFGDTNEEEI